MLIAKFNTINTICTLWAFSKYELLILFEYEVSSAILLKNIVKLTIPVLSTFKVLI